MQRDASHAALTPVVATLRDIAARHGQKPVHGLAPGIVIDDPSGWTPARALVSGSGLSALLDSAKQRWHAQPHAAAALAWKCYVYWAALPALIGFAGARRVPLPRLGDVSVRHAGHQPFLRLGLRRPTVAVLATDPVVAAAGPQLRDRLIVCADEAELLAELRRALLDEHLEILMAGIQGRVHLGRRTLLGSVASGAAHALTRAADSVPGPVLPLIGTVLAALDVADLVDVTTEPATGAVHIARRTCCLAFTLPEPKICTGCCIR